jgi:signal peptidase
MHSSIDCSQIGPHPCRIFFEFKAYFIVIRQFYIRLEIRTIELHNMQRIKSTLEWNERSDTVKTGFILILIVGGTLGGYGIFMVAMGTTTPLVVVTSESMVPTLQVGDLLVLRGMPEDQIQVGHIIVFKDTETYLHTDNPIVHRIIDIQEVDGELQFYTQGDANPTADSGYRRYDEIIGVMVTRIPYIGSISMFLRTPTGIAVIAILFILILVVPEFVCNEDEEEPPENDMSQNHNKTEPPS